MQKLVKEFREARKELIKTVDELHRADGNIFVSEKWKLQDILSHLSGWAIYQLLILRKFKNGNFLYRPVNSKLFNSRSVRHRKNKDWGEVYQEFKKISLRLINEYQKLPRGLWRKPVWFGKNTTPKEFIQIEINHYRENHLLQIKKLLSEIKK